LAMSWHAATGCKKEKKYSPITKGVCFDVIFRKHEKGKRTDVACNRH
jgi:hypothetical protein